jgi:NAD(P)-dependent dehydrogenase (short-subunit alcohol dehydrogenase family)
MQESQRPVCVVLGAGPGNGAAIARRFAEAGSRVALMARDLDRITTLAGSIAGARAIQCDASNPRSINAAFAATRTQLGPVDTLIYNAGTGVWGDALTVTPEDFESTWRLSSLGAFLAAREVLPQMLAAGTGRIIFVGATASRRGGVATAAFAPAKAAQKSLAESLARSYGSKGIHVALIVIDAVVDEPKMRSRMQDKPDDFFCKPADIADTIFMVAQQRKSAWTFELEVRPFGEKW